MGTTREDSAFLFSKKIIGIENWDEIIFKGEVDSFKKQQSYHNINSDTWRFTDALGRKLPTFEETGPVKKNRYVGMFYFLIHNSPGKDGLFDVTKIKAENPDSPQ